MFNYILRRLLLLPITLLCIIFINFLIINLAPGDPVTVTEISPEGSATRKEESSVAFGSDDRYLQFREHYGLTLPILFNSWPQMSDQEIKERLWQVIHQKDSPKKEKEIPFKKWDRMRINLGDRSKYIMPKLLSILEDPENSTEMRQMASRFFARGGTMQAHLGGGLSEKQKQFNKKISIDNNLLNSLTLKKIDSKEEVERKITELKKWYLANRSIYRFEPTTFEKVHIFFFESRFFRYLYRVLTLDFGTLRNDSNKTVINEVTKRFRYSLTLAVLPLLFTFVFCQFIGFTMAIKQNRWQDLSLNLTCLILYAIPIFVVAPFLIEKVALNGTFPFTDTPIPLSGFTSPDNEYQKMVTHERLLDIMKHIFLPLIAILYGSLAAQSRLSRTAVLEIKQQDYIRTAKAKGVPTFTILYKHIGRNAAITIVTAIASSLGIVLGGSLIVETLFEIDGYGKFFYDSIINRDYNVIMFSALAGSALTLAGYLLADIAYTLLDPRVTLE